MFAAARVFDTSIFFVPAEDGIRVYEVPVVQTCALPISCSISPLSAASCACTSPTPEASRVSTTSPSASSVTVVTPRRIVDRKSAVEGKGGDWGGRRQTDGHKYMTEREGGRRTDRHEQAE